MRNGYTAYRACSAFRGADVFLTLGVKFTVIKILRFLKMNKYKFFIQHWKFAGGYDILK